MKPFRLKSTLFLIVFVLVAVDQLTKWWVETRLPFEEHVGVVPFFALYRTYNTGIAFSMLDWMGSNGLVVLTVLIIGFLIYLWSRVPRDHQLAHLGFAFVMAGAVGNLIDRASLGYVIDFLLFHTQNWAFAIFNMADAFITLGAIAIIIDEIFSLKGGPSATDTQKHT